MTFNPDDAKYTAYALGELNDADRAAVDAEMQNDSRVAALLAEIQKAADSVGSALREESLPQLTTSQHAAVLAAMSNPTNTKRRSRSVAWAMAVSAALLLAAGTGWVLRDLNSERVNQTVSMNSLKQVGDSAESHEAKLAAKAPPAFGGVAPSAVTGLDATGNPTSLHDIQFRQGGISGPTPSFSEFSGDKSDGSSQAGGLTINGGTVGGQGVTSFSLGVSPQPHVPGLGYGGIGTLVANHRADGRPLDHSGATSAPPPGISDSAPYSTDLATSAPIVKHLAAELISSSPSGSYTGATTATAGTLTLNGTNAWGYNSSSSNQQLHSYALANGTSNPAAADPNSAVTFNNSSPLMARNANASSKAPEGINAALREDFLRSASREREFNTESYDPLVDNQFLAVSDNPLSTFSIDVDTASYSNIRRFLLQQNQLPPAGAVRIEELINYFHYQYPQPEGERPFSVTTEVASCPWAAEHRLVRIGLKGREIAADKRPPTSLVFLIDVSGSMEQPNKLPLVQESLKLLAKQLTENDHVAIVVYAGNSGMVLPSTRGDKHEEIIAAIERLRAGGSTNGGQGIQLAYEIASQNFLKGGVNRVILATDGDFNVGITNQDELVRLIQEQAKTGVFLTTLGFGYGNLKDSTMQKLADKGNGNNYYIDDLPEARKVLVEQMGGTLVTIAKDVKIQIEFNPQEVAGYRLIGYEKRMLAKEDFNNDKIDAGEIGAGHTVTALYEVVTAAGVRGQESGVSHLAPGSAGGQAAESGAKAEGDANSEGGRRKAESEFAAVDSLRYVKPAELTEAAKTGELFTLKLRYKQPDGEKSSLMETPVKDAGKKYGEASGDFKFAAAVASFGMILRDSQFKGNATLAAVQELAGEDLQQHDGGKNGANDAKDNDERARRAEFIQIIERAKTLKGP